MTEVEITVHGEHRTRVAPELGTIHVTVRAEAHDRASVTAMIAQYGEPIRRSLSARKESGTLLEWTSERMSLRVERPWNTEGKQLAPVHHASVSFAATFADVSELSLWVSEISEWEGVEIGGVEWKLTPETRASIERSTGTTAVSVAIARAQTYANALGLTTVTAVSVADAGLISQPSQQVSARAFMLAESATRVMEYEPDDIEVTATVEARFRAR